MKAPETSHHLHAARRTLLRLIGLAGVPASLLAARLADAAKPSPELLKTPSEVEGPYYPVSWSGDVDGDLLQLADGQAHATDRELILSGQVLRPDGSPASGARVAIWQCDSKGRYRHPRDAGEDPAQDGFQGYGQVLTDAQGNYQFRTLKPVAYGSRPPHVHFRVEDGSTSLTTQMYFEGENKEQSFFARFASFTDDRTLLTVKPEPMASSNGANTRLQAQFNVYL